MGVPPRPTSSASSPSSCSYHWCCSSISTSSSSSLSPSSSSSTTLHRYFKASIICTDSSLSTFFLFFRPSQELQVLYLLLFVSWSCLFGICNQNDGFFLSRLFVRMMISLHKSSLSLMPAAIWLDASTNSALLSNRLRRRERLARKQEELGLIDQWIRKKQEAINTRTMEQLADILS